MGIRREPDDDDDDVVVVESFRIWCAVDLFGVEIVETGVLLLGGPDGRSRKDSGKMLGILAQG